MLELKEQGNELYRSGNYLQAAALYTKAIKQDPGNPVLYSNRSAALLRLNKLGKALADAEECLRLDPSWDKGWARKGMVLELQGQLEEAVQCYQQARKAAASSQEYAAKVKALTAVIKRSSTTDKHTQAALEFAERKLQCVKELIQQQGSKFPPELHFWTPESSSSGAGSNGLDASESPTETIVRAERAFEAPEVLGEFVKQMRSQVQQKQASGVLLVAPKSAIAFPQTWRQQSWQHGSHDGVFVQLQARIPAQAAVAAAKDGSGRRPSDDVKAGADDRSCTSSSNGSTLLQRMWFIRVRASRPPSEPQDVPDEFALLPPLLK